MNFSYSRNYRLCRAIKSLPTRWQAGLCDSSWKTGSLNIAVPWFPVIVIVLWSVYFLVFNPSAFLLNFLLIINCSFPIYFTWLANGVWVCVYIYVCGCVYIYVCVCVYSDSGQGLCLIRNGSYCLWYWILLHKNYGYWKHDWVSLYLSYLVPVVYLQYFRSTITVHACLSDFPTSLFLCLYPF